MACRSPAGFPAQAGGWRFCDNPTSGTIYFQRKDMGNKQQSARTLLFGCAVTTKKHQHARQAGGKVRDKSTCPAFPRIALLCKAGHGLKAAAPNLGSAGTSDFVDKVRWRCLRLHVSSSPDVQLLPNHPNCSPVDPSRGCSRIETLVERCKRSTTQCGPRPVSPRPTARRLPTIGLHALLYLSPFFPTRDCPP